MAFNLGGLLGNFIPESYGLTDQDKRALAKQGLLASGLAMLSSQSGGNFSQSLGEGLQSGLLAVNRGANSVGEQRYRQQAMQQQLGGGTDFRALDAKARAAGFEPGTDEYKRAFQVALGTEGRASSAGYGFFEFEGSDGRKRMGRNNPRTGEREVYDEAAGEFVPLGGMGDGVPTAPPATPGFGIAETDNYVRKILSNVAVDPNATPEQQAAQILPALIQQESGGNAAAVSPKGAVGLTQVMPATGADPGFGVSPLQNGSPEENVRLGRDYLTAMLKRYPGRPDLALAAYNAGPGVADRFASPQASARPGIATGRRPEDEAAAVEAAKRNVELSVLPTELNLRTNAALNEAKGKADIATQAEVEAQAATKRRDANVALDLIKQARSVLPQATGGGLGASYDKANAWFGKGTAGANANAKLQTIAGQMTSKMPRMEGPQSDRDVEMYKQMAGDVGNASLPVSTRLAALDQIELLNLKYADQNIPGTAAAPAAAKPAPRRLKFNPATGKIE
ncbi:lytic transglycosylase domain-containing protein [Stenotrophomonas sp. AB1(2024)]|uniref:lytic transglycosylase domain-containing protein n=1 Tax=Stenotrophomonas sp. AB1(2024) TaxID=3132215 RepID=UPI0030B1D24E